MTSPEALEDVYRRAFVESAAIIEAAVAEAVATERRRAVALARELGAMCPGCDVFRAFITDLEDTGGAP